MMILKFKSFHIMLPKICIFVKSYGEQTKWDVFFDEDDDLLDKYNTIWDKFSTDIKKEFDGKPVYNLFFLKTEIKSYGDEVASFLIKKGGL